MEKIKIMIVDDHFLIREGLKSLFTLSNDFKVIAEAENGKACLATLGKVKPDIILMDIKMKDMSGIEATRLISQKYPEVKIIMLTMYDDYQYINEAIKAGARGYISKKVKSDDLFKIIHHIMENGSFLDPMVTSKLFYHLKDDSAPKEKSTKLSTREIEIAKCLVSGKTDSEIAKSLFISEHTVRSHIKMIYKKLDVKTRAQAIVKVLQEKMCTID